MEKAAARRHKCAGFKAGVRVMHRDFIVCEHIGIKQAGDILNTVIGDLSTYEPICSNIDTEDFWIIQPVLNTWQILPSEAGLGYFHLVMDVSYDTESKNIR